MTRHKTRPTLNELEQMPLMSLRREIAQLCVDAAIADHAEVLADAEMLAMDPDPKPERILELWNLLRGERKGMDDKAKEEFERLNGRLLIGGPCDGERHVPRDIRHFEMLVRPLPGPPVSFRDPLALDPVGPAPSNAIYLPETLRGDKIEVLFYRHSSISIDEALVLMLARYPKQKRDVMNWTTEYPTKPGFYWIRNYSIRGLLNDGPVVVKVVQFQTSRVLEFCFTGSDNYFRESVLDFAEWQGPISPDADLPRASGYHLFPETICADCLERCTRLKSWQIGQCDGKPIFGLICEDCWIKRLTPEQRKVYMV